MTALLAIAALMTGPDYAASPWETPTTAVTLTGRASYYRPGLMRSVQHYRGIELEPGQVCVALNRKGDLGRDVWIGHRGAWYRAVSCDCAQKGHYPARLAGGYVVEVPFWLAEDWGMAGVGPVDVEVRFTEPERIQE